MAFEPLVWYCRPVSNGVWARAVENAFGAYTPCATDSLVTCISHSVVLGLCLYRIWRTKKDYKAQRFQLMSKYYNFILGLLAGYCTAAPLYRLVKGISVFNVDGQIGIAPFEVSLCVKRLVYTNNQGEVVKGVCWNFLCDLKPGSEVKITGPVGKEMLMPKDPNATIVMDICMHLADNLLKRRERSCSFFPL